MTSVVRCPHEEDDDESSEKTSNSYCCCHYDPFDDDSPESRIKDLSFALRKLSVMKCQMRKWRVERLELESRVRTMSKCLRANGVNVDVAIKVDPLVTHLRVENQKLENRKAALEDEVRDLKETLKERECFEDEPCKAVIYAREKMLEVRTRCAIEKRQLRETMASLQLKLEEASERLANEVDQQQVSKKSIGELCAQLKKENKRLLAEVETLKKCATAQRPNTAEMAELCERVRVCECEATQLRRQIAERDAMIQDLEKRFQAQRRNSTQLEKVAVSQRALGDQNVAMKAKQKQKDEKHSTQLDAVKVELEKARANGRKLEETSEKLGKENGELRETKARLEDELAELAGKLQRGADELRCAKEGECRAKAELERLRKEASERQDELASRICEIEAKARIDAEMLRKTRDELDCCRSKLEEMRRKLEESKTNTKSAEARNAELQRSLDSCTSANDKLTSELELAKAELGTQLEDTKRLRDELKVVQCELDRLKNTHAAILAENTCLKKDNDELKKCVETLKRAKETLAADLVNVKIEMQSEKQRLATEARRQSADTENELKSCRAENKRLKCSVSECKKKAQTEMACVSKALKEEMQAQIEAVNCVTELMNYAAGRLTKRPETSTRKLDANGRSDKWSAPEIIELFDSSRILTEDIYKAEEVARNLELKTKDEAGDESESGETRTSVESTKKEAFTSKSNDAPRPVFPCAVSPIVLSPEKQWREKQSPERELVAAFDPASWLKSLSLTELAELHEQICDITSNIVSDDGAKLQRRIVQREREVAARATETKLALLKEQMRLARVADAMHRESRFALHISVDARMQPSASGDRPNAVMCCMREDCLCVGCAVDFDPHRRK